MPEAGKTYGPKKYNSLNAAYNAYRRHRAKETGGKPHAVAPRAKFAKIWEWTK